MLNFEGGEGADTSPPRPHEGAKARGAAKEPKFGSKSQGDATSPSLFGARASGESDRQRLYVARAHEALQNKCK